MRQLRHIKLPGLLALLLLAFSAPLLRAQQYDGMSGLIHVPTAEMDSVGVARVGTHLVNSALMPDCNYFTYQLDDGSRHHYDSFSYYLSITPFRWVEATYTCVLLKWGPQLRDFTSKDRHFSVKFNPIREGRFVPAIALGSADFMSSNLDPTEGQAFWANYYLAATKHFEVAGLALGAHLTYRYYLKDYNKRFQGLVGGLTIDPSQYLGTEHLRAILEFDGRHFNLGADWLVHDCLLLQASLTNFTGFSAGLCYRPGLLR